jgi:hypothetical protein
VKVARGAYGFADAPPSAHPTGNRASEAANSAASAYACPTTSKQLASITLAGDGAELQL